MKYLRVVIKVKQNSRYVLYNTETVSSRGELLIETHFGCDKRYKQFTLCRIHTGKDLRPVS